MALRVGTVPAPVSCMNGVVGQSVLANLRQVEITLWVPLANISMGRYGTGTCELYEWSSGPGRTGQSASGRDNPLGSTSKYI